MAEAEFTIIDSLAEVDPAQWQALAGDNPTLSYTFTGTLSDAVQARLNSATITAIAVTIIDTNPECRSGNCPNRNFP